MYPHSLPICWCPMKWHSCWWAFHPLLLIPSLAPTPPSPRISLKSLFPNLGHTSWETAFPACDNWLWNFHAIQDFHRTALGLRVWSADLGQKNFVEFGGLFWLWETSTKDKPALFFTLSTWKFYFYLNKMDLPPAGVSVQQCKLELGGWNTTLEKTKSPRLVDPVVLPPQ